MTPRPQKPQASITRAAGGQDEDGRLERAVVQVLIEAVAGRRGIF